MIIENGKGIEVNTAGLKYGMSDPNPHHEIIKRYMELGGEIITIGSDGHCPKHMAYDFCKLPDFLSNLGIRYYTVFRDKKPEFIKLCVSLHKKERNNRLIIFLLSRSLILAILESPHPL